MGDENTTCGLTGTAKPRPTQVNIKPVSNGFIVDGYDFSQFIILTLFDNFDFCK